MTLASGGEATRGLSLFAGREAELAQLGSVLDDVVGGLGRAVVVSGQAGVGKSALVEALARRAADAGVATHWARGFEMSGAPAFWPWTQLVRSLLTHRDSDLDAAGAYAASIIQQPSDNPAFRLDQPEDRFRLFDGVVRLLAARASPPRPQLLVFEDAHAADHASLELLAFVVAHIAAASRTLLVATYRDNEAVPPPRALLDAAAGCYVRLQLKGLSLDALCVVVADCANDALTREALGAVREATAGNPLLARALVRDLDVAGVLPHFSSEVGLQVPASVRALFETRFERLDEQAAWGLALLAAAGRDVDEALGHILLESSFAATIDAGLAHSILEKSSRGPGVRFVHSLVEIALLERLSVAACQQVHAQVAAALVTEHRDDLVPHHAAIGQHYSAAGPEYARDAFEHHRAAGDQARLIGAVVDAASSYSLALESALAAGVTVGDRAAVLADLGHARIRAGELESGRGDCVAAWDIARRAGVGAVMGQAALACATLTLGGVVDQELVRLLSGALAQVGSEHPGVRARLRARLAAELAFAASREHREALASEAVAEARSTDDPRVLYSTIRWAEAAMSIPEHVATCRGWMDESVALAESMHDLAAKADAHAFRSVHRLALGDVQGYNADVEALGHLAPIVHAD